MESFARAGEREVVEVGGGRIGGFAKPRERLASKSWVALVRCMMRSAQCLDQPHSQKCSEEQHQNEFG